MKATDFRVGNYLNNPHWKEPKRIIEIMVSENYPEGTDNSITDDIRCEGYHLAPVNGYLPIRLTVDWLDDFNFKWLKRKAGTQGMYSNGKMNVVLSNSGNVYTTRNKLIPYVHTFQNLYYFHLLTGEELIFTT